MKYADVISRLFAIERPTLVKALRLARQGYGNLTLECDITRAQSNAVHEWVRLFGYEQPWDSGRQTFEPITINVRKEVLLELRAAEEGAYEDAQRSEGERSLSSHIYLVAGRYPSRLLITSVAEAEDAYYAVCSGTFSMRSMACYNAAVRIATALVRLARPETVKLFPISQIEKPDV